MQHPSLLERAVGATLRTFSRGEVTQEEAELDLVELIACQIIGKTDYTVATVGFYVRSIMKALSERRMAVEQAYETFVDAAIAAGEGEVPVTTRLAQALHATHLQKVRRYSDRFLPSGAPGTTPVWRMSGST